MGSTIPQQQAAEQQATLGRRRRTALDEVDTSTGAFKRKPSAYRDIVGGDAHPVEKNRYCLYISLACPWACRCLAVYYMKGLDSVIQLSIVHPVWARTNPDKDSHTGWQFADPDDPPKANPAGYGSFSCEGCIPDPLHLDGVTYIRDLYEMSGDTNGKYTVPVLFDSVTRTIVNNESADIVRMLNASFNQLIDDPHKASLDLYPPDLRESINTTNDMVYESINNGVYRCGFAKSQEAYDEANAELFAALDRCEDILTRSRYLCGDTITEADIRLFVTLIRFDTVYVVYFKTSKKTIREYPALSDYVRDLYSVPEIRQSVDMKHIKHHYFASHPTLNPYAIVPADGHPWWEDDHARYKMTKQAVAWSI
ncbi:hypothetical protein M9434_004751 [Picochlorum sp. BPE23]|nr:hypothetical protein M9434_004751 [Picochlorum sp. BPE23]